MGSSYFSPELESRETEFSGMKEYDSIRLNVKHTLDILGFDYSGLFTIFIKVHNVKFTG